MATGIENYPNITPISSDYPKGDLRDKTSGAAGTPINRVTNADIHQTFAKLLIEAGITANGLPENVTNGYQYFEALELLYNPDAYDQTVSFVGVVGSFVIRFIRKGNFVTASVISSSDTGPGLTNDGIPIWARPTLDITFQTYIEGGFNPSGLIIIKNDGTINMQINVSSGHKFNVCYQVG